MVKRPDSERLAPVGPTDHPFDRVSERDLRRRQSAKWTAYPPDVLPAWVAEMDYPLAEPILRTLREALEQNDAGYAMATGLAADFANWAQSRFDWDVAIDDVRLVTDVVTGIAEVLRAGTAPGDGVLIEPPVYPPFASTVRELGRRVLRAPLVRTETGWAPDLLAIESAYAAGARAHLLCSPHNPTGLVIPVDVLARIAELAERHGVLVLSDEIHAPLTLPGASHVPFPMVSEAARRRSVVLTSASKAWNIAGLKAAAIVGSGKEPRAVLAKLPPGMPHHAGHFGVLASRAAFREGAAWLGQALAILDRNRALLGQLLEAQLPDVVYVPPQAGYLAWLDCRALGLGADPAAAFLARGRVALSSGPTFGREGEGFARLNIATTRTLLEEAVRRLRQGLG